MTPVLMLAAFALGAAVIAWIGQGFRGVDPLAFGVTVTIGGVFLVGVAEQWHFRYTTTRLIRALRALPATPDTLTPWLAGLPASLQPVVRSRLEGERAGLPGPVLTPYLVGLLVMLGLLGTFVGLVVTLQGTVQALEGSTELKAIREGLAAPIQGLSLAFGTSVAGVAASALLGLISTLTRRERLLAGRQLDARLAGPLRIFSQAHQRQEAYRAIQQQAEGWPALVQQLQAVALQMSEGSQRLGEHLTRAQSAFHEQMMAQYERLAQAVGLSLKESLTDSAQQAAAQIRPVVEQTMAQVSASATQTHQHLQAVVEAQNLALTAQFRQTAEQTAQAWQQGLGAYQAATHGLLGQLTESLHTHAEQQAQQSDRVLARFDQALAASARHQADQDQQRLQQWAETLSGVSGDLITQWQAAGLQVEARQQQLCRMIEGVVSEVAEAARVSTEQLMTLEGTVTVHLTQLGTALEAPLANLIEKVAEAPRAAADVIARLRQELNQTQERDNALLDERQRLMQQLDTVLKAQAQSAQAQQALIEQLVGDTRTVLQEVGCQFVQQVQGEAGKLADAALDMHAGAVDMASLSEAFTEAVHQFGESNDTLVSHLARIEQALTAASTRSDEQLAYYVEQAREVIELSTASQREVIEALQALQLRSARAVAEAV
ncbi:MAG: hypothetical protein LPK85_07550 [Gammaproteobacteria bacterium]|nr:hypothetical protein [Gammaproteobacteria bacterium]